MRVLDLFCGGGGASEGYGRAGFEVVGIDDKPQPHYPDQDRVINVDAMAVLNYWGNPSAIWGPDDPPPGVIRHPVDGWPSGSPLVVTPDGEPWALDDFDLIHASPPCQGFTRAAKLREAQGGKTKKGAVDLLTPTLRLLDAIGKPYIVENVPGAPMRKDIVLCGSMFGLKVRRHRWFQTNLPIIATAGELRCDHKKQGKPVGVYHVMGDTAQGLDKKTGRWVVGGSTAKTIEEAQEAMGIDWLPWNPLKEAIPPAYTEWLGRQAMEVLDGGTAEVRADRL